MEITTDTIIEITFLDTIARDILDIATDGVVVGGNSRIVLNDTSQDNQDKAQNILDNFGSLTVTASATNINEGDADPIITCDDVAIANDTEIGWVVIADGELYADGITDVTAGTSTLTLTAPTYGVYDIYLYRLVSDYSSGSITVTVNEV
jgi:hypothetical protein